MKKVLVLFLMVITFSFVAKAHIAGEYAGKIDGKSATVTLCEDGTETQGWGSAEIAGVSYDLMRISKKYKGGYSVEIYTVKNKKGATVGKWVVKVGTDKLTGTFTNTKTGKKSKISMVLTGY